MCEWGPCSGQLYQAYLMLRGCVGLHYPLLNIRFLHTHVCAHTHAHTEQCRGSGPRKVLLPVFVPVINWRINVCLFWTLINVPILGKARVGQINQSSLHLSLHVQNTSLCNPPLSQLGPNVRPFHSQSGQIFVSSSLPMHLTLSRLIALCTGQTCYLLV